jgi:hypothetical protein
VGAAWFKVTCIIAEWLACVNSCLPQSPACHPRMGGAKALSEVCPGNCSSVHIGFFGFKGGIGRAGRGGGRRRAGRCLSALGVAIGPPGTVRCLWLGLCAWRSPPDLSEGGCAGYRPPTGPAYLRSECRTNVPVCQVAGVAWRGCSRGGCGAEVGDAHARIRLERPRDGGYRVWGRWPEAPEAAATTSPTWTVVMIGG